MATAPEIPIGERLRFYRQAQNKKQAVVAGLAGVTEDYLSQIERGLKTPTITLLHRFASVLGVPVSVLLGEPSFAAESVIHPVAATIQAALLSYQPASDDVDARPVSELRDAVTDAWAVWQGSERRYSDAASILPGLVGELQRGARATANDPEQRREAARLRADLYFLLRTFAKRIGRPDLSLLVADRAVAAAEDADDPLRIAAAQWNLGQILLSQGEAEGAEEIAIRAAERLAQHPNASEPDVVAMHGALWLVAAVAAVRNGDAWTARERLREQAWPAAKRSGERNVMWTVFGPTNVAVHAVSIEMESGEAAEALRLADDIDIMTSPSLERRTTFYLEVARCYEQRRDDAGVLLHLMSAESTGPEDMRYNVLARDLVRGLLKRARPTFAPQVRDLARRVGLLNQ